MISEEAIEQATEFGRGHALGERRLMLELLEHLEEQGFTVTPADGLLAMRDAGQDAGSLPVPRLQLRWDGDVCHYELILRLSEFDIRRETLDDEGRMARTASEFMAVPLGRTHVTGGDGEHVYEGKVSTPYRDGSHASWDAAQLGLPCYAVCGEHVTPVEVGTPPSMDCSRTPTTRSPETCRAEEDALKVEGLAAQLCAASGGSYVWWHLVHEDLKSQWRDYARQKMAKLR